jgi:hypothetical protein
MVKKEQLRAPPLNSIEGRYLTRIRRRRVYLLRIQNKTVREMADDLQAGQSTIIEDLRQIDEALKKEIDPEQGTEILNEKLLELEGLKVMAMEGATDSEGNERIGFLNTATKINELQAKLLGDAGIIKKVLRIGDPDGKPFTTPQRDPEELRPIMLNMTTDEETEDAVRQFGTRPASLRLRK